MDKLTNQERTGRWKLLEIRDSISLMGSDKQTMVLFCLIKGKMDDKELIEIALTYLSGKIGCPGHNFKKEFCKNCSEDQDLSDCWREYLEFQRDWLIKSRVT